MRMISVSRKQKACVFATKALSKKNLIRKPTVSLSLPAGPVNAIKGQSSLPNAYPSVLMTAARRGIQVYVS